MILGIRRELMGDEGVEGREEKVKRFDGEKNKGRKTDGGHRLLA